MFSFGDLKWLRDCYNWARPSQVEKVFIMLVCKNNSTGEVGTYSLKIDNFQALDALVNSFWNHPDYAVYTDEKIKMDKIHYDQSKKYAKVGSDFELSFLKQFPNLGASLYKATDDLTNWTKLELDPNPLSSNPIKNTPCN